MIESILATDIAKFLKEIATIKSKHSLLNISKGENVDKLIDHNDKTTKNFENQQEILELCIHFSDISNVTRSEIVTSTWVSLIFEEFFITTNTTPKTSFPKFLF